VWDPTSYPTCTAFRNSSGGRLPGW
jgi:hypothetical protein